MKMYKIIKPTISIDNYQCIVMATSYTDPLEKMDLISNLENDLRDLNIQKGEIIFDLLTCIGDNFERFSTLFFDGYKFNLNSYEVISVPKKSILRKNMTIFFNKLDKQLENTVLNSNQIRLIRHGLTI